MVRRFSAVLNNNIFSSPPTSSNTYTTKLSSTMHSSTILSYFLLTGLSLAQQPSTTLDLIQSPNPTLDPITEFCEMGDTNEQCCKRLGDNSRWCSGRALRVCYKPDEQEECCDNDASCAGQGCCEKMGANSITPDPNRADDTLNSSDNDNGAASTRMGTLAVIAAGFVGLALI